MDAEKAKKRVRAVMDEIFRSQMALDAMEGQLIVPEEVDECWKIIARIEREWAK